jgi:hypothetical protein
MVRALPGGVALAAVYLVLGLLRPAARRRGHQAWPGSPWDGWAGRRCWPEPPSADRRAGAATA